MMDIRYALVVVKINQYQIIMYLADGFKENVRIASKKIKLHDIRIN